MWVVICGIVECYNAAGQRVEVGADFGLGFFDALADVPRRFGAVTKTDAVLLSYDMTTTLGIFEQHADMGMQMLRGVSRAFQSALDEQHRRASEAVDESD